jgi:excisionase family DNA binding protein
MNEHKVASAEKDNRDLDLLSREQAARRLNISHRTLHDLIHSGRIPYVQLGRRHMFIPGDLDAYIKARRIGG